MWSPRFRRSDVSEAALKWELGDTDAVGCAGGADDSGTKPARRVAQLNRLSVRLSMTSRCRGRLRARAARSACSRREPVIAMPTRLVGPTAANSFDGVTACHVQRTERTGNMPTNESSLRRAFGARVLVSDESMSAMRVPTPGPSP